MFCTFCRKKKIKNQDIFITDNYYLLYKTSLSCNKTLQNKMQDCVSEKRILVIISIKLLVLKELQTKLIQNHCVLPFVFFTHFPFSSLPILVGTGLLSPMNKRKVKKTSLSILFVEIIS